MLYGSTWEICVYGRADKIARHTCNRMLLMRKLRSPLALLLGLAMSAAVVTAASAQSAGTPVPAPGSANTLTGANAGTVGSGANNSAPSGGPALTGTPHEKTHKRHNRHMYGKHYNYMKHSKR
jgi:hypothetical protein